MDIGKEIKKYRKLQRMTQEELAERLSVTPQAVSRWENNLSYPDVAMIPEIVNLLRVSADELLGTGRNWGDHSPEYVMVPLEVLRNLEYRKNDESETLNQDQVDCIFKKFKRTDDMTKSVLVIDDAAFMRNMVSDILERQGHRVWLAESGEAGLEDLKRSEQPGGSPFDLCLLDIRMPGRNGLEILEQIREQYPGIKVVMLSAASTRQNVEMAKALGAEAFVVKPFSEERLLEII